MLYAQAASSLENLKVKDSPIKKLNFNVDDKENNPVAVDAAPVMTEKLELAKVQEEAPKSEEQNRPKTLKELEAEEDLLKENPHRFVLFPIKYHEIVSACATRLRPATT